LRVITWNIWNGGEGRLDAIERVLREQDADVIALQEANDREAVDMLGAHLGMTVVYGEANSAFAVAWLSRLPVERAENHRLPQLAKTLLEIEVPGHRLYTTHLIHGRTEADGARRVEEVELILACLQAPCLLVGDFNAVHPGDAVGTPPPHEQAPTDFVARRPVQLLLESGFTDCYRAHHDDRGWTYESSHLWFRPDYVFAAGLEPRTCDFVETDASDHFALVAEF
jgi:endonuclease/exonuclease/phosphatase family metal-dependent hydrolase